MISQALTSQTMPSLTLIWQVLPSQLWHTISEKIWYHKLWYYVPWHHKLWHDKIWVYQGWKQASIYISVILLTCHKTTFFFLFSETFIKRYIVKRTNTAEIRPEEDQKNRVRKRRFVGRIYGIQFSWKGYRDRNRQ